MVQGCEQADLRLSKVFPATAVLNHQFRELPVDGDEVVLVAAETGGNTTVVIGRKDGQIYLGRTLNSSWNIYPDRVNVDLNRTLLYVKQQFGAPVDNMWLVGTGAGGHADAMEALVKVPIKLSPIPYSPFYWNEQALKLPFGDTNNLVSAELHEAPKRRVLKPPMKSPTPQLRLAASATSAPSTAVRENSRQKPRGTSTRGPGRPQPKTSASCMPGRATESRRSAA